VDVRKSVGTREDSSGQRIVCSGAEIVVGSVPADLGTSGLGTAACYLMHYTESFQRCEE
jgi:hypothetical protein